MAVAMGYGPWAGPSWVGAGAGCAPTGIRLPGKGSVGSLIWFFSWNQVVPGDLIPSGDLKASNLPRKRPAPGPRRCQLPILIGAC